jgi:NAD(P)-dependent dehydrogenase (short-subunit alcohol dehydrogenase family)
MKLQDKVAIITGVSGDGQVGQAVAQTFAREGARLVLVARSAERLKRIDILVNLAGGLTRYKAAAEHTLEDWETEISNNLLSAFLCSRAAFGLMKEQGGGKIVNFTRAGGPQPKMVAYNCAKAGVEALTHTFALEGRKHNINVNAVAPGLLDTKSNVEMMKPKPEDLAKWPKREEIAETVAFLASDAASGITGQVIEVKGKL